MSRITGLAITGLAIYLAVNSLPDSSSREDHVTAVAIATDNREGIARDLARSNDQGQTFSADRPLLAGKLPTASAAKMPLRTVNEKTINKKTLASVPSPLKTITGSSGTTDQKINGEILQLATNLKPVLLKRALLPPPKPVDILRDTQFELKRIGCYRNRIDGIWGKGSKWALSQFIKRTDKLPRNLKASFTNTPNPVLLDVLRKTSNRICGRPCASGKMLSSNGRCINDPVIMASISSTASWTASVKPAPSDAANSDGTDRKAVYNSKPPKVTAKIVKRAKAKRKKRASRKWRKRRYSLGGPKVRSRHIKRRRVVRRYRYVRRYKRQGWKRRILSPEY